MAVKKKNIVEVETPNVEVEEVVTETTEEVTNSPVVDVDIEASKSSHRKEGSVKIRMRADHRCTIAMEHYDLKAGQVYVVPENVKRVLNNAGLLAPL